MIIESSRVLWFDYISDMVIVMFGVSFIALQQQALFENNEKSSEL